MTDKIESAPSEPTTQPESGDAGNLAETLSQVISRSMEKLGDKLAESLSSAYEDFDEYEEDEELENLEPPAKKPRSGGAFGVLQDLLTNAVTTPQLEAAPSQEKTTSPINDSRDDSVCVVNDKDDVIGDAIIHTIMQDMSKEGEGDPVREDIAGLIDALFKEGLPEEKLKEKMTAYAKPANVACLAPVKVNSVIWDSLPPPARSMDLKMQKVHNGLIKALIAATQAASGLKNVGQLTPELGGVLEKIFDSIIFACTATKDLNLRRRELLKPAINQDFGHLCSANVPMTDELFGSDLSQQVKDLSELNKVAMQLKATRSRGRGRGRFQSRKGPFLGRGAFHRGGSYNRGRGRGRGGPRRGNLQRYQNKSA
jgi:hypothetical protein